MSESDWGTWLPDAIADAEPETVAVWYLGCNGFVFKGCAGTTVWIDPYVGLGDPPRTVRMIPVPFDPEDVEEADAVLATHEHTDHVHGPSQAPILATTGATYYAPDDSLAVARDEEFWTEHWGVEESQFAEVSEGDTVEIGEFEIDVVEVFDPDATHPVGYVIEHDAGTVFHGGDTKPSDDFSQLGQEYDIDLGILAFGSVGRIPDKETREPVRTKWYSDENEIVEAASDLQFDRLVPSHWDMWKGLTADPTVLHDHVRSFEYPRRLEVVEIGDRIDL
ncbi:Zn-dependent hydrolase of the beta-lactamase fold [Halalkaliarchaeum sp. AArc-CO]|uniref:MBL fold metallo-hydrolase n=1 Tax=Halalkaliarchaeum sp. AArc-CO TaxID=2866381 RepID=UPI00217DD012|nr:MBL fold metallo-hydrolase [Halalkaliarchaeum sp. AArc-CO]UWG49996.1 Zn-dependent hydrolase of the beta-lactamase fold [Halalkaliarchaeum sp. AArc-CO]